MRAEWHEEMIYLEAVLYPIVIQQVHRSNQKGGKGSGIMGYFDKCDNIDIAGRTSFCNFNFLQKASINPLKPSNSTGHEFFPQCQKPV